jgi:hypothetical protein
MESVSLIAPGASSASSAYSSMMITSTAAALGAVSWAKVPGVADVILLLDGQM